MRKVIVVLVMFLVGFSIQSQEKDKNAKITFEVDGLCGMCKKRIETASLKTKGVKFASWNVETHQLSLILDERKTTKEEVQKNILAVGHDIVVDTKTKIPATIKAYESVHPCCKYRDEEIIKDHEGELKKQKKQN
jgi:cation transport ATPase